MFLYCCTSTQPTNEKKTKQRQVASGALQNRTCRLSITLARSKRWRNGEQVFPSRRQPNEASRNCSSGLLQTRRYTEPGNCDCAFSRRPTLHTIYPREDGHEISPVQRLPSLRHRATPRLRIAKSQLAPLCHSFTTSFCFCSVTSRCPATSGSCNSRSWPTGAHKTYAIVRPQHVFFFSQFPVFPHGRRCTKLSRRTRPPTQHRQTLSQELASQNVAFRSRVAVRGADA